jgi:negative regulator of flagellin synthesis FlgM
MRVGQSGNSPQGSEVQGAKKSGRAAVAAQGEAAKKADQAQVSGAANTEISSKAKEMAKAKDVAASAPDVREEKIAELKRRIAAGKYQVDSDAIADRMVNDHLSAGIG